MTDLPSTTTFEGLVAILRSERQRQGISQIELDAIAGLANGHVGKIECQLTAPGKGKGLGKITMPLLLGALGLQLAVMPGPTQHRDETREILRERQAEYGRRGRQKQLATQTKRQRKRIARAAAQARWARQP